MILPFDRVTAKRQSVKQLIKFSFMGCPLVGLRFTLSTGWFMHKVRHCRHTWRVGAGRGRLPVQRLGRMQQNGLWTRGAARGLHLISVAYQSM